MKRNLLQHTCGVTDFRASLSMSVLWLGMCTKLMITPRSVLSTGIKCEPNVDSTKPCQTHLQYFPRHEVVPISCTIVCGLEEGRRRKGHVDTHKVSLTCAKCPQWHVKGTNVALFEMSAGVLIVMAVTIVLVLDPNVESFLAGTDVTCKASVTNLAVSLILVLGPKVSPEGEDRVTLSVSVPSFFHLRLYLFLLSLSLCFFCFLDLNLDIYLYLHPHLYIYSCLFPPTSYLRPFTYYSFCRLPLFLHVCVCCLSLSLSFSFRCLFQL